MVNLKFTGFIFSEYIIYVFTLSISASPPNLF